MKVKLQALHIFMLLSVTIIFLGACLTQKNNLVSDSNTTLSNFSFDESSKVDNFYLGDLLHTGKVNDTTYYIYSQRRLFDTFYKESRDLNIEAQKDLWVNTTYNKIGKSFYTDLTLIEFSLDSFDKQYASLVLEKLTYINKDDNYNKITRYIKAVENNIEEEVTKTIKYFGHVGKELYVLISYVGESVGQSFLLQNNNKKPMFIVTAENFYKFTETNYHKNTTANLDFNSVVSNELKKIIPHELVHSYQLTIQDRTIKPLKDRMLELPNYLLLFYEGVAVYIETKINNTDDTQYSELLKRDYSTVNKNDIAILAKEYLTFYEKKAIEDNFGKWSEWIGELKNPIEGKMYPSGLAYFLGYWVTKDIIERQNIKIDNFLRLSERDPQTIQLIQKALLYLSQQS